MNELAFFVPIGCKTGAIGGTVKSARNLALILVILAAPATILADDLTGSEAFLCTVVYASTCTPDGECIGGPAWDLNIPQFIEVDLKAKTLSTTKASHENRSTPIKYMERDEDLIILQGVENARAFSLVITESTGMVSIGVAMADKGVVVSGVCTPH